MGKQFSLATTDKHQLGAYCARIAQGRNRISVGAPATVKAKLKPLIEATKADELMVTSMIFDHAARKRSYELLAQAFVE